MDVWFGKMTIVKMLHFTLDRRKPVPFEDHHWSYSTCMRSTCSSSIWYQTLAVYAAVRLGVVIDRSRPRAAVQSRDWLHRLAACWCK